MRQSLILLLFFGLGSLVHGQVSIPDWFIEEIRSQEGTWVADNSEYPNDGVDKYAIEWKLSPLKNSLYGRLFGIKNNVEVGTFWSFHKYYDPAADQVLLLQIGSDGTLGIGPVEYKNDTETSIVQTFTDPKGISRLEGHKMTYPNKTTEIGSSYAISKSGEWTLRRTYTWTKI